jgi:hypothetical protein
MTKVRETKIVAYTSTFEWIFEDAEAYKPTGFVRWLTDQDVIY